MGFWEHQKVCVTGGAAMIGTHLIEKLINLGVGVVWVADDLSSGKEEWLPKDVELIKTDLRDQSNADNAICGADIVFHLASQHGGRGFVDSHRLECLDNLGLTSSVFRACKNMGVEKVVFASSACAYPTDLQTDKYKDLKLSEDMIDLRNIRQADNAYGVEKLVGEITLDAYADAGIFDAISCRMFTAFGARVKNNHAIGALIAKTIVGQEPYEIWGKDGTQQRNWTFVKDTAYGLALAAEHMTRGAVNIGTEDRITVNQAAETIWDILHWKPKSVKYLADKPVGTLNRVADASKARDLLGWTPKYSFREGLCETIEWFAHAHKVADVRASLEKSLTER